MTGKPDRKKKKEGKRRRSAALFCNILGTVMLVALVLVCLPLTVPRLFGYHIYTVISGSMEPAIPTGSLVYIQEMEPEDVEADDVIAFYGAKDSASIITHRVVENRVLMGEFMNPASYENFIGKVVKSYPEIGEIAQILTGPEGKVIAGGVIAAAVVLQILASMFERRYEKRQSRV